MKSRMKSLLFSAGKLGFAGATLVAIAWSISVGDPVDGVQKAEADIGTWVSTKTLLGGNYGKTMESLGMKPRAYEMNGNQVFFGVGRVDSDPRQVLEHYQEQFVAAGINKRKFLKVPDSKFDRSLGDMLKDPKKQLSEDDLAYNEALLMGGVVPITEQPGYIAMGGIVPKGEHENLEEMVKDWQASDETRDIHKQMNGFRFIDARQFPGQTGSRITSVWADSGFDSEKMANPKKNAGPPVLRAPVCMGCDVGMQMKSLDRSEPFRIGHFYSQRSREDLIDFYTHAMPRNGFRPGDSQKAVDVARHYMGEEVPDGAILQYVNDAGVESLVAVFDDTRLNETSVVIVESH